MGVGALMSDPAFPCQSDPHFCVIIYTTKCKNGGWRSKGSATGAVLTYIVCHLCVELLVTEPFSY